MGMFDNYPQPSDYIPTNMDCKSPPKFITIMAGETTVHSFEIPFNIEEEMLDYNIIYRLGSSNVIIKTKEEIEVIPYDEDLGFSILTSKLSADETAVFANTFLSCEIQIKLVLSDGSTIFTDKYPVELSTAVSAYERGDSHVDTGSLSDTADGASLVSAVTAGTESATVTVGTISDTITVK